jgi:transposase-like protein
MKKKASFSLEDKSNFVKQYKSSGLSIREFAQQNSIPVSTLYGWLRQLRKQQSPIRIAQVLPMKEPAKKKIPQRQIEKAKSSRINISVGPIQIQVGQDFDQPLLRSILEVLCEFNTCDFNDSSRC